MTTICNTKIGVHKKQPRIWLEGQKLSRAGIRIGSLYGVHADKERQRIELREVSEDFQGQTFTVSRRDRNGVVHPVMDVRSQSLKEIFEGSERVRVAIKDGRIVVTANHLDVKSRERVARVRNKVSTGQPLAVCSLFHGGGVLDKAMHEGLARVGVQSFVQVGVELEPTYLDASLRNNPELWRPDSIAIASDIREVNLSKNAPQCEILIAGIPCTGASRSGRSKNKLSCAEEHDSAGALFVDYLDAVKAVNPAVCIIENVPEYQNSSSMMVIRSVLVSLGYNVIEAALDGSDYGSLERRRRLAVVAYTPGAADVFNFDNLQVVKQREATLSEILEDVPLDSTRWKTFEYLAEKEVRDIAAGKGFRRQLLTADADGCGVLGKGVAKCRSTEPFLVHPVDGSLSRIFTPVEHARLKGIPETVIAGESDTSAHEILGQSVIYPLFVAIGVELGKALLMSTAPTVSDASPSVAILEDRKAGEEIDVHLNGEINTEIALVIASEQGMQQHLLI